MKKVSIVWPVLMQFAIAFEWLHATYGKWSSTDFMDNISKTLEGFATKTPYTTYADFLKTVAIPNAELFGNMIRTGELAVGLGLALSGIFILSKNYLPKTIIWLTIIACFAGALMNINFFLASGSISPSSWGLNILMASIEIILGIFFLSNREDLKS